MVDENGEFFLGTLLAGVVDFVGTLFTGGLNGNDEIRGRAWARFDPTREGSKTNNAWDIDIGLFQTDPHSTIAFRAWQIISRLTWEYPQVMVGKIVAHAHNITGGVKDVTSSDGATLVESYNKDWGGITFGNYIIAQRGTTPSSQIFMHEWGHTRQSMEWGPFYLPVPGLYSGIDYLSGSSYEEHNKIWPEKDANRRAHERFGDKFTEWGRLYGEESTTTEDGRYYPQHPDPQRIYPLPPRPRLPRGYRL